MLRHVMFRIDNCYNCSLLIFQFQFGSVIVNQSNSILFHFTFSQIPSSLQYFIINLKKFIELIGIRYLNISLIGKKNQNFNHPIIKTSYLHKIDVSIKVELNNKNCWNAFALNEKFMMNNRVARSSRGILRPPAVFPFSPF